MIILGTCTLRASTLSYVACLSPGVSTTTSSLDWFEGAGVSGLGLLGVQGLGV